VAPERAFIISTKSLFHKAWHTVQRTVIWWTNGDQRTLLIETGTIRNFVSPKALNSVVLKSQKKACLKSCVHTIT